MLENVLQQFHIGSCSGGPTRRGWIKTDAFPDPFVRSVIHSLSSTAVLLSAHTAMALCQKNSILRRRPGTTKMHVESQDAEQQRLEARDSARARRKEVLKEHLVKAFYPTAEEKQEFVYVSARTVNSVSCLPLLQLPIYLFVLLDPGTVAICKVLSMSQFRDAW
jgi:hypothetical protein